MDNLLDFEHINERICKIKLIYWNLTLMPTQFYIDANIIWHWCQHTLQLKKKDEVTKEEFYSSVEKVSDAVTNYDMKTVLEKFTARVGKESYFYSECGG